MPDITDDIWGVAVYILGEMSDYAIFVVGLTVALGVIEFFIRALAARRDADKL